VQPLSSRAVAWQALPCDLGLPPSKGLALFRGQLKVLHHGQKHERSTATSSPGLLKRPGYKLSPTFSSSVGPKMSIFEVFSPLSSAWAKLVFGLRLTSGRRA